VTVSYQAQSPVLGLVLPSNSPGVHTLLAARHPDADWSAAEAGPQEPWTPYRMAEAFIKAGRAEGGIAVYPGLGGRRGGSSPASRPQHDLRRYWPPYERYKGDRAWQVHGPGFSKILLGDDVVDHWEKYLDVMADSVFLNSGRGLASTVPASGLRDHTRDESRRR